MPLNSDLREFVALLNSREVEYLVVGAYAVAFYGYPRYTADLDLLINPTSENASRVLKVLGDFGFESLKVTSTDLQTPNKVIQLGVQPNRIDLLTSISGVGFPEAWNAKVDGDLQGISTRYIGREQLIRNKEATGRGHDLADAEKLRKRLNP